MSISFVRVQHTHVSSNSATVGEQLGDGTTVPAPVNGDLGLFILANNKGSTASVTGASGWTNEIPRFNPGNTTSSSPQGYMDYRVFSGDSGALPIWTLSAACEFVGAVLEYAGVNATTPFDVTPITDTTGAASLSGLTTVTDGCLLIYAAMYDTSTELWSADQAGWTQRVLANDGANMRLYIADKTQTTHGDAGTVGPTWSTAPAHIVSALFALRPASAGGTNATVTPSVVAATSSVPAPTVSAASNATVTPNAVTATGSVRSATVSTTSGVQFVRTGGTGTNNSTNSIVNLSSQVTDGNLLLFAIGANKGTQTTWTDPAGLTAVADDSSGGNSSDSRTRTFTRLALGDAGATYTFTSSAGVNHAQAYLEYSDVDETTPLASASVSTGHDTTLLPGVTTQADKALIVVVLTLEGGGTVTSPPSTASLSFTLRQTLSTTSGSDDVTLYVYDAVQPKAGPTGTITWSGTPTNSTYQVFALRQAVAPFSTTVTPSVIAAPSAVPFGQINQGVQPSALSAATTVPDVTIVASGSLTNVDVAQGWYTANTGNTPTGGTATVTLPSAPTEGNTLVIAANSDQAVTTPTGWTVADSLVNVSGLYLFTKTAGASESADVSVTFSGVGAFAVAELVAAAGTLDSSTGQITRTSGSAPVTVSLSGPTGSADEYVVAVMGSISGAQLQWDGWSDGFIEQADTSTALTSGSNVSLAVADYNLQGPATYSVSASTYDRATGLLAGSAAQGILVAFQAIAGSATVRAATAAFTGRALDATVVVPVDATVTATTIAAVSAVPTVAPTTPGSTVVPAQTITATSAVPSIASSTASSIVFPDTVAATSAVITPDSVADVGITAVTPPTVSAATSVPTPTITVSSALNATVAAQTIRATTTVPAVGLTAGVSVTVQPNAYAALAAVLTPAGLANSVTVAAPTIRATTTVSSGNTSVTIPTYTFTPPTVFDVPQLAVGVNSPMNRLAMHMNAGERGISVWVLKNGTYTTQQPVYWEDVDHVFYGGHSYTVSAAEATTLVENGFTVTEAVPQ